MVNPPLISEVEDGAHFQHRHTSATSICEKFHNLLESPEIEPVAIIQDGELLEHHTPMETVTIYSPRTRKTMTASYHKLLPRLIPAKP